MKLKKIIGWILVTPTILTVLVFGSLLVYLAIAEINTHGLMLIGILVSLAIGICLLEGDSRK